MRRLSSQLAVALALLLTSCRRESAGQTALLLKLATSGPCDCVTIREGTSSDGGGELQQALDRASGLPAEFTTNAGWRTAQLTALVYSGGQLGSGSVVLTAEGHRGSCSGPVVLRFSLPTSFSAGQVVEASGKLELLAPDKDGDGWPEGEDCDDNDPTIYPGAPELCDGKDHSCSGVLDKGCPCGALASRGCYPTPRGLADPHVGVGLCKAGVQLCQSGKWAGHCEGAVLPAPEQCDGKDHDCDGDLKEGCADPACNGSACDGNGGLCKGGVCVAACSGPGPADCADPHCKGKRCAGNGVCTAAGKCVLEICNNKLDDNGDGLVDCQDALACPAPGGLVQPLCCSATWVDTASDPRHCGDCATDCTAGHSSECGSISCAQGKCSYGNKPDGSSCTGGLCCHGSCSSGAGMTNPMCCSSGWVDVDHGDPLDCGSCGRACTGADSCHTPRCDPGGVCGLDTRCNNPGCDGQFCRAAGVLGQCSNGICCAGCVTQSGTCSDGQTALHACGSQGNACTDCQPSSNPCIADQCASGSCTHTPLTGQSCTAQGGAAGKCTSAGACCGGCVDLSGACQPGTAVLTCGSGGATCQRCPLPTNQCQTASCSSAGVCGTSNVTDGTSCSLGDGGTGNCQAGQCTASSCSGGAAQCGGACCNAGETCSNNQCVCDKSGTATSCVSNGGCCSTNVTQSRCLQPAFSTCVQCGQIFCSSGGTAGTCVSSCASSCGTAVLSCNGNECLVPDANGNGASGNLNICSTPSPANQQACVATFTGAERCSCNAGDPSNCTLGDRSVCRSFTNPNPSAGAHNHACFICTGSSSTIGLPCKKPGTTCQSDGSCQ